MQKQVYQYTPPHPPRSPSTGYPQLAAEGTRGHWNSEDPHRRTANDGSVQSWHRICAVSFSAGLPSAKIACHDLVLQITTVPHQPGTARVPAAVRVLLPGKAPHQRATVLIMRGHEFELDMILREQQNKQQENSPQPTTSNRTKKRTEKVHEFVLVAYPQLP